MTTTAPSWLADIFSKLTDYQAWKAMLSKEPWPSVLLAAALLLFIMAPNYMFQVSAADEKRMEEIREQFQKSKFAKDLKLDEKYGQFRRNREVFTPSSNANAAIERSQDYRVKQQAQTSTGSKKDDSRGKQKEASSTSTSVMPSKVSELKMRSQIPMERASGQVHCPRWTDANKYFAACRCGVSLSYITPRTTKPRRESLHHSIDELRSMIQLVLRVERCRFAGGVHRNKFAE